MSELKGIWVVAEHHDGTLEGTTLELLGKARELGAAGGQPVAVVLIGQGVSSLAAGLGDFGADEVLVADLANMADGAVLAAAIAARNPALVLFPDSSFGVDLSGAAAGQLQTAVIGGANAIGLDGGQYKITRPIYGGNALATLSGTGGKSLLVTVQPKAFEKATAGAGKAAAVTSLATDAQSAAARAAIKDFVAEVASGKINLNDAEIVVSGGRGVGGADKFAIIEDLARALGAAVGASRAVTDAGWRPVNEQIGQTGVTIKPKLYIAAGISGAVQHWVGMKEAGYIIAINTDPEAPIMKVADLAIVGNLFNVIPELVKEINAAKGVAV